MKALFYLLSFVLFSTVAYSQLPLNKEKYADSILSDLKKALQDSSRAKNSFLLSEYYNEIDSAQALLYFEQGRQYSKGNKFLEAVCLYYKALLTTKNAPAEAEKLYLLAEQRLAAFTTTNAIAFRARCWHDYAKTIKKENDDTKTYVDILLNKAIPLAIQSGDQDYLGKNYLDLSFGFKNLNDFPKAEVYLQKAIATLRSGNAPQYLASAYHTLGENSTLSGKAREAKAAMDSMKALLLPYPQSDAWLDYYAGESMRLTVAGQFDLSLATIDKGIHLAQGLKQAYPEQRLLMQKFYALYNKKDFLAARETALDLTTRKEFMKVGANRGQIFYCLAVTYEELKDMSNAYKWLKRYSELSDSLNSSKLMNDINALEVKYQSAEKQKKITELEAERQKTYLKARNQRLTNWMLGIASIFLLLTTAFLIVYYRNNKKLLRQKEINYQQQLKEVEQQQQLRLTQAMLEGEERERQRVARDLHDGLGGMLAGIKIKLSGQSNMQNPQSLDGVILQLDQSVTELRRIARNMMPESLLRTGLETALRDLCESLMSDTTTIELQTYGIKADMPAATQANIYRIIQEILSNAIRHAQASKIIVQCSQNENVFLITVEDNGKGFDVSTIKDAKGIGFNNIKSRVEYFNGSMDVSSVVEEGTTINIELSLAG